MEGSEGSVPHSTGDDISFVYNVLTQHGGMSEDGSSRNASSLNVALPRFEAMEVASSVQQGHGTGRVPSRSMSVDEIPGGSAPDFKQIMKGIKYLFQNKK